MPKHLSVIHHCLNILLLSGQDIGDICNELNISIITLKRSCYLLRRSGFPVHIRNGRVEVWSKVNETKIKEYLGTKLEDFKN